MVQPLDNQHCNKSCPNLNAKGVLTHPDKGFDLEVLFQGLEEDLYLPSLFVDGTYCGGSEPKVISEKDDLCFILVVPYHDPSQGEPILLPSSDARETDGLVLEHRAVFRNASSFGYDV